MKDVRDGVESSGLIGKNYSRQLRYNTPPVAEIFRSVRSDSSSQANVRVVKHSVGVQGRVELSKRVYVGVFGKELLERAK
jgi:hypothetical protein